MQAAIARHGDARPWTGRRHDLAEQLVEENVGGGDHLTIGRERLLVHARTAGRMKHQKPLGEAIDQGVPHHRQPPRVRREEIADDRRDAQGVGDGRPHKVDRGRVRARRPVARQEATQEVVGEHRVRRPCADDARRPIGGMH